MTRYEASVRIFCVVYTERTGRGQAMLDKMMKAAPQIRALIQTVTGGGGPEFVADPDLAGQGLVLDIGLPPAPPRPPAASSAEEEDVELRECEELSARAARLLEDAAVGDSKTA